jgi:hypothetical protein
MATWKFYQVGSAKDSKRHDVMHKGQKMLKKYFFGTWLSFVSKWFALDIGFSEHLSWSPENFIKNVLDISGCTEAKNFCENMFWIVKIIWFKGIFLRNRFLENLIWPLENTIKMVLERTQKDIPCISQETLEKPLLQTLRF